MQPPWRSLIETDACYLSIHSSLWFSRLEWLRIWKSWRLSVQSSSFFLRYPPNLSADICLQDEHKMHPRVRSNRLCCTEVKKWPWSKSSRLFGGLNTARRQFLKLLMEGTESERTKLTSQFEGRPLPVKHHMPSCLSLCVLIEHHIALLVWTHCDECCVTVSNLGGEHVKCFLINSLISCLYDQTQRSYWCHPSAYSTPARPFIS